jgi:anti-anti-sigma factor
VPATLIRSESLADRDDVLHQDLVCSCALDGLGAAWVHADGELDMATVPLLGRTLGKAQPHARLVVLDLRELAFMDSCGAHLIVDASIHARRAGRRLVLLRAPSRVDAVFNLIGRSGDLEIIDLDLSEPPVQVLLRLAGDADSPTSLTPKRPARDPRYPCPGRAAPQFRTQPGRAP